MPRPHRRVSMNVRISLGLLAAAALAVGCPKSSSSPDGGSDGGQGPGADGGKTDGGRAGDGGGGSDGGPSGCQSDSDCFSVGLRCSPDGGCTLPAVTCDPAQGSNNCSVSASY